MNIRTLAIAATAATLLATGAFAANNAPLSGAWNIAPTGSAASSGELLFRMTPGNGDDPVEVTVSVMSGNNEMSVARDIRRALSTGLRAERFNVQLGQGANVLVTDARGRSDFSLELIDSDVENLRVVVQSVEPSASPTVRAQSVPATPPQTPPASAPGNAVSPGDTAPPANAAQPAAPLPANAPPLPNPSPPPNSTGGAGAPATAPAPMPDGGAPASTLPPNAAPRDSTPAGAPPPTA